MVFYKHLGFFDDLIILIFIIVSVTFSGLFLSFQVHLLEYFLTIREMEPFQSVSYVTSVRKSELQLVMSHIFEVLLFLTFLMLNVPSFYAVSRPLDLCKARNSPGQRKETKKN